MRAKVRGIYTTALTRLLLDNGFEIIEPSLAIKNRFGLADNFLQPDMKVKDRYDMQGVRVLGKPEAVEKFKTVLQEALPDVITRKWIANVDGIYKGKVVEISEDAVHVDIGGGMVGQLPKADLETSEGESLLVQVERRRIGARQPILTTNLKIIGEYAILVQKNRVGVSLKIRDINKRAELYTLGKKLAPEGWGIIWREASAKAPTNTLEDEVRGLVEKAKTLNEKAAKAEVPSLLVEGLSFMDVEFPFLSKRAMDKLRAHVTPTLDGHHFYKSCGGRVSSALEMAEKLLENGQSESAVKEAFKQQILYEFPEEGSIVDVEHVKLNGAVFHLGQAEVESVSDRELKYSRIMQSKGFYDGLGVEKEAGDKAVSETEIGELYITTSYFSSDGNLKGKYINLNTPLEVYPQTLRYVDLEVDVCILPNGTTKVLDMEKLEKALERGLISRKFFQKILEKVEEIKRIHGS
ncbi:MAG: ribonuclease E/G [Candidatus Bathyarchaeia archaeon]